MKTVTRYNGSKVSAPNPRLSYPVNYIGITRGFTAGYHGGIDFGWNSAYGGRNQDLVTVGAVNRVRAIYDNGAWNGGYGNYITLDSDGFVALYGHCMRGSFKVKVGDVLPRGVPIAKMNNSGNSYGDHLHFELYYGSTNSVDRIDPLSLIYVLDSQTVSPNTALKSRILYMEEVKPMENVGQPVSADKTKNQVKVSISILRGRSSPNLMDNVKGYVNQGYYNILEVSDGRHEASNGYLWYKIGDYLWCADVSGVEYIKAEQVSDIQDTMNKIYQLAKPFYSGE